MRLSMALRVKQHEVFCRVFSAIRSPDDAEQVFRFLIIFQKFIEVSLVMAMIDPFPGNCPGHYGHLQNFYETLW
jgi:hypothetical protein